MTKKQRIRRFFPAGNTTKGFYSFFDDILPHEEANRIYSFKGGPGTGKSSMMRKISQHFETKGLDVEYHHCSSDPDSLDAIVVSQARVAFMDGTAPHVVDPKTPGAIDEIINLGDNWNREKLVQKRDTILKVRKENSRLFQKAYGYLKAVGHLYENYEKTALTAFDVNRSLFQANQLIQDLLHDYPYQPLIGKERHLFGFGITPKGIVHFRDDYLQDKKIKVRISESIFSTSEQMMNRLKEALTERGFSIICLHSPIKPEKIVEIICDELELVISVDTHYYQTLDTVQYTYDIDLSSLVDNERQQEIQKEVEEDLAECDRLLKKAVYYIHKAKNNHHKLEQYYVDALDFSKHDELTEILIEEIESYL